MYRAWMLFAAAALWAGDERCAVCHPEQTAAYRQTGMGRGIRPAGDAPPRGSVKHGFSGARFTMEGSRQRVEWKGLDAEYEVAYWMGSGRNAMGGVVRLGPSLAQSPVTWYAERRRWDMAPGYERHPIPDFNRVLTAECLACHANLNRDGLEPIGCNRCHGEAAEHLANPSKRTIVNPARLSGRARDSVCEQCHLSGEVRVLNPGASWTSFQPGRALEESWTVYTRDAESGFKVVSHSEQLARSRCAAASEGRLWCGSCHSPHRGVGASVAGRRTACLSCHAQPHEGSDGDCVGCHMPKRKSWDSGHAAFTDHRIRRKPDGGSADPAAPVRGLAAWRPAAAGLESRNLGIASIAVGERDRNLDLIQHGYRVLTAWAGDPAQDADAAAALGFALTLKGRHTEAAKMLARTVALAPAQGSHRIKLATAYRNAGDIKAAAKVLEEAIAADPWNEAAYHFLAGIEGKSALGRFVRVHPRGFAARVR